MAGLRPLLNSTALTTILGTSIGADNFGTFTGSTIPDGSSAKQALQALETFAENINTDASAAIAAAEAAATDAETAAGTANTAATAAQNVVDSISGDTGASIVGTSDGNTVQDNLDHGGWFTSSGTGAIQRQTQNRLLDLAVSALDYGAVGDGVTDDTAAVQAAINTGRSVHLPQGKTFLISSALTIASSNVTISGGGKLKVAEPFSFNTDSGGTHMLLIFVTGSYVTFDGIIFDATGVTPGTAVENGFVWSTAPYTKAIGCTFIGNPKGTCFWSLASSAYPSFVGNTVTGCSGAVFTKGRNPVIADNIIINATDAAIAINGQTCIGGVVSGNTISNENLAAIPSMIAVEEGAAQWAIVGNVLLGVNGGGILCTNVLDFTTVEGGTIAGNYLDGKTISGTMPSGSGISSMISISPYYRSCVVTGNKILNCPSGNTASRFLNIGSNSGIVAHNYFDGTNSTGIAALVSINPGGGAQITVRNNTTIAASGVRHYLYGTGDFGNAVAIHEGGEMLGGAEGINTALSNPTNLTLYVTNLSRCTATSPVNIGSNQNWGSRQGYFNLGYSMKFPHRINTNTEMYGNAVPTTGTWAVGDTVWNAAATVGSPSGWRCVTAGSPGTWAVIGQNGPMTSIGAAPSFIGQVAVVSGVGYIATGTSATADWKQTTP